MSQPPESPSSPSEDDSKAQQATSTGKRKWTGPRGLDTSLILSEGRRSGASRDDFVPPVDKPLRLKDYPAEETDYVKDTGRKLFEAVMAQTEDGTKLAQAFWTLPDRDELPDYYEVIKTPQSLADVDEKLKSGSYKNIASVKHDISHAFWNAKRYNEKGTTIFLDAKFLDRFVKKLYQTYLHPSHPDYKSPHAAEGDSDEEGAPKKKVKRPNIWARLKGRLDKVVKRTDSFGRQISWAFMDLVPRPEYPDYYKMIRRPRSFNVIYGKLRRKQYEIPEDFVTDVDLIFTNAKQYNQEGSQIWVDADNLMEYFHDQVDDIINEDPDAPPAPKIRLKLSNGEVPTIRLKVKPASSAAQDDDEDVLAQAVAAIIGEPVPSAPPPLPSPAAVAPPPLKTSSSAASTPSLPSVPLSQPSSIPSSSQLLAPPPARTIARPKPPPTIVSTLRLRQLGPSASTSLVLRNERGVKSHVVPLSEGIDTIELELGLREGASSNGAHVNGAVLGPPSSSSAPLPAALSFPKTYVLALLFNNARIEPAPSDPSVAVPPGPDGFSPSPPLRWRIKLPRNQASWVVEVRLNWKAAAAVNGQGPGPGPQEGRGGRESYEVFLRR